MYTCIGTLTERCQACVDGTERAEWSLSFQSRVVAISYIGLRFYVLASTLGLEFRVYLAYIYIYMYVCIYVFVYIYIYVI